MIAASVTLRGPSTETDPEPHFNRCRQLLRHNSSESVQASPGQPSVRGHVFNERCTRYIGSGQALWGGCVTTASGSRSDGKTLLR